MGSNLLSSLLLHITTATLWQSFGDFENRFQLSVSVILTHFLPLSRQGAKGHYSILFVCCARIGSLQRFNPFQQ